MRRTWIQSYHKDGDYLVLSEMAWWVSPLEAVGVPLIGRGWTYRFGNWLLFVAERGYVEVHRLPLPGELSDPWWRDEAQVRDATKETA